MLGNILKSIHSDVGISPISKFTMYEYSIDMAIRNRKDDTVMSIYYENNSAKIKRPDSNRRPGSLSTVFTDEQLDLLASVMHIKKYSADTHIFWEGDEAIAVYWILKGRVKLRKSTSDGKDLLLSILQPDDMIADIDTWDTSHRYTAETIDEVEVGIIPRLQLEMLMCKHGDFAYRYAMWMGLLQRKTESKLRDLLMGGKNGALASTLIRLCNSFGERVEDHHIRINIKLTNNELAELVGTTREGVNRLLASMKKDGIVTNNHAGYIVVTNIQALKDMAGCPLCPTCPNEICRL